MENQNNHHHLSPWQLKLHRIIFEADTPAGKLFDVALLWIIVISVGVVILESIGSFSEAWGPELRIIEWTVTFIFTAEYILRILSVGQPLKYIFSFFGIVDLLSIFPTYLSLFYSGAQSLLVIRALRLLRVFRVLKLVRFVQEALVLKEALKSSFRKIFVFIGVVLALATIIGALMYLIEGEENGFTSIPQGIYWAIVTLSTVGYGDLVPQTTLGKIFSSFVMILGYGVIAVPTGIVSVELSAKRNISTQACPECSLEGHDPNAKHCKFCGAPLDEKEYQSDVVD